MSLISDRPQVEQPATPVQPALPVQGLSRRNKEKAHALGLTSATGLVIGSIVGTGVFTMPAVLAGAGTMGIVVLGVIAVGAMLLATLFGQLTKRVPNSDGGLYAYSRHEFGDFADVYKRQKRECSEPSIPTTTSHMSLSLWTRPSMLGMALPLVVSMKNYRGSTNLIR